MARLLWTESGVQEVKLSTTEDAEVILRVDLSGQRFFHLHVARSDAEFTAKDAKDAKDTH